MLQASLILVVRWQLTKGAEENAVLSAQPHRHGDHGVFGFQDGTTWEEMTPCPMCNSYPAPVLEVPEVFHPTGFLNTSYVSGTIK